jgi:DNA-binding response OmpR family regulator
VTTSVLLVDDDQSYLALAARVLEEIGVEVAASASDAASAIEAARNTKPNAALVDVGLPDRDGIDLAYELADLPWGPRVVLMSTDRDAVGEIEPPPGREPLEFIPKQELAHGSLRRLLTSP